MKYEAPICEIVRIDTVDIIRTSGPDDTAAGDTPFAPVDNLDLNP